MSVWCARFGICGLPMCGIVVYVCSESEGYDLVVDERVCFVVVESGVSSLSKVVLVVDRVKKGLGSRKIRVDTIPAIERNKLVGPCLPGPE